MLELHARNYGEQGPWLILLHGLFGASANWGSTARQLAAEYRVLVPDLRNHGQSPHHDDVSYPAMAGDVLRLLDRHAIERATLVGHSMGGKVAMLLALNHPDQVDGVAVIDIAPVAYRHHHDQVFAAFDAVDLAAVASRADADRQMAAVLDNVALRAFLLQNLVREGDRWRWRLNLSALLAGQRAIIGFPALQDEFPGPAVFIHGARSDYVLPEYHPTIRSLFPRAGFCAVADAGHWVYAEQPQGFARCLGGFLSASPASAKRP